MPENADKREVLRFPFLLLIFLHFSFSAIAAPAIPCAPAETLRALMPAMPEGKKIAAWGFVRGIERGSLGQISKDSDAFEFFELALKRRAPLQSGSLISSLTSGKPLNAIQTRQFIEAVSIEFRENFHSRLAQKKIPVGSSFQEYALRAYQGPGQDYIDAWKKLGFWAEGETLRRPTYGEIATRLRSLQDELGVPAEHRLAITAVYQHPFTNQVHFHALDRPLGSGLDVPTGERFLSNSEFFQAIDQGLMLIEAETHDLGHVIAWTLNPNVFAEVKKLAHLHLKNPADEALFFRLHWAAENLALPRAKDVDALRPHFLSKITKGRSDQTLSAQEHFNQIKKVVNQKPFEEVAEYAEKFLEPRYRKAFEPYGGAPAQFGEVESVWTNERNQSMRFFEDRTPVTEWNFRGKDYRFSGTEINQEQPLNLAAEIRHVLFYKGLPSEAKEAQIKNLVARMEFALDELSKIPAESLVQSFSAPQKIRQRSRVAEILKILRGEHSSLYRIYTQ